MYKTIIRPAVTYGSETWTLRKKEINKLLVWERKILRIIYGPCRDSVTNKSRSRYNNEIETLFGKGNIVRYIKTNRLRWAGHVVRSDDDRLISNVFWERPDGRRSTGRPRKRWKDAVREDLEKMEVRPWEIIAQDRNQWKAIVLLNLTTIWAHLLDVNDDLLRTLIIKADNEKKSSNKNNFFHYNDGNRFGPPIIPPIAAYPVMPGVQCTIEFGQRVCPPY
ncbi:unnamed protein product [Diabrotica balteata]|uniref:Endonuclease-reverse transcriptase n=1 Tax=Diabrotica balteata TaxID=107213 RepID=A0A9N9SMH7_DIABA|nr:unnamed protein product [Diabrotica balteata]